MFTFLSQKSNETSGSNGVARGQVPLPGSRARQPWQAERERRPLGGRRLRSEALGHITHGVGLSDKRLLVP